MTVKYSGGSGGGTGYSGPGKMKSTVKPKTTVKFTDIGRANYGGGVAYKGPYSPAYYGLTDNRLTDNQQMPNYGGGVAYKGPYSPAYYGLTDNRLTDNQQMPAMVDSTKVSSAVRFVSGGLPPDLKYASGSRSLTYTNPMQTVNQAAANQATKTVSYDYNPTTERDATSYPYRGAKERRLAGGYSTGSGGGGNQQAAGAATEIDQTKWGTYDANTLTYVYPDYTAPGQKIGNKITNVYSIQDRTTGKYYLYKRQGQGWITILDSAGNKVETPSTGTQSATQAAAVTGSMARWTI